MFPRYPRNVQGSFGKRVVKGNEIAQCAALFNCIARSLPEATGINFVVYINLREKENQSVFPFIQIKIRGNGDQFGDVWVNVSSKNPLESFKEEPVRNQFLEEIKRVCLEEIDTHITELQKFWTRTKVLFQPVAA